MASKRRAASEGKRPIKARGAAPAPKVAPRRVSVVWYRKRSVQIVGALGVLAVLGVAVLLFFQWRRGVEERRREQRAIRQFDRSISVLAVSLQKTEQEMSTEPQRFKSGELSQEDFKKKTEEWQNAFTDLSTELRQKTVPDKLEESRALLVEGAVLYLDAVKVFQTAAAIQDQALRDQALQQGTNIANHAGFSLGMGRRSLEREKRLAGIASEGASFLDQPIPLPEEEVVPQPPVPPQVPITGSQ